MVKTKWVGAEVEVGDDAIAEVMGLRVCLSELSYQRLDHQCRYLCKGLCKGLSQERDRVIAGAIEGQSLTLTEVRLFLV